MKKFLVIYGMSVGAIEEMKKSSTPEEMKEGMKAWEVWMEDKKDHMVDPGDPAGKNTRVTKSGAKEVPNEIGGYSIFEAETKEDVLDLLKDCPHLQMPSCYIEVMEAVDM